MRVIFSVTQILLAVACAACSASDGGTGAQGPRGEPGQPGEAIEGPEGPEGPQGDVGEPGPMGMQGAQGPSGSDGQSCWDLNGNGACDHGPEDWNGDDACDVLDCQGPKGNPGAFQLLDADGVVLGALVTETYLVRTEGGVLLRYHASTGVVTGVSGAAGQSVYFASSDCTGTALAQNDIPLLDAAVLNDGSLYRTVLPITNLTPGSERDDSGTCSIGGPQDDYVPLLLVGAKPADAKLPFQIRPAQ